MISFHLRFKPLCPMLLELVPLSFVMDVLKDKFVIRLAKLLRELRERKKIVYVNKVESLSGCLGALSEMVEWGDDM